MDDHLHVQKLAHHSAGARGTVSAGSEAKGWFEVARTLRIEWAPGEKVTGRLSMPAGGRR